MIELLGLVLVVQGGGGVINNLFAGSKSWFALNYLDLPMPVTLLGHVLLLAAGLALAVGRSGAARLKGRGR